MGPTDDKNGSWIGILAPVTGAIGALVAISGPMLVLSSQPGGDGGSIWPLPGLVLMDWAILGVLGFLAAYLGIKPETAGWAWAAWFVVGALFPLMVLGALSIGPFVLLNLIFFTVSAILVTIRMRLSYGKAAGFIALGWLINLGLILLPIVFVGNL